MYYECHITIGTGPKSSQYAVELLGWKFSRIMGDPDLGYGPREYATRHVNPNVDLSAVVSNMNKAADVLKFLGFHVLRQKVELVMHDTKGKEK